MRQALHNAELAGPWPICAKSTVSPQRAHTGPLWTGNSIQQASQIGTLESCGSGEPQREQEAGRRAQLKASMGLRSTRATARQREVSDGGTSSVSEPEFLRKTHLSSRKRASVKRCLTPIYTAMIFVRQACAGSSHGDALRPNAQIQSRNCPALLSHALCDRIENKYP
jgi:hypothetical protein